MLVVALFTLSKIWKQFKYLPPDKENVVCVCVCVYLLIYKILNIIQQQKEGSFVIFDNTDKPEGHNLR